MCDMQVAYEPQATWPCGWFPEGRDTLNSRLDFSLSWNVGSSSNSVCWRPWKHRAWQAPTENKSARVLISFERPRRH